ncbi:MAG TPA: response regulator transcription factor [Nitrospiraceae bacterium]|nr:response regulator transcription factor [Nitrospiraceae bacterium]
MIGTQLLKLLVVGDHGVARQSMKQILEDIFPHVEVEEVDSGPKAIAAVQQEPWDLGIVDIGPSDQSGLELLAKLHNAAPRLPLVVLGRHTEEQYAIRAFRAGAMAYLTKQTGPEELAGAVKQVLTGRMYVTASLGEQMAGSRGKMATGYGQHSLSERELEVLVLIARGRSVKSIAQSLALSSKTVSTYRARLLDKLQLRTTGELVRYALDHQLVK